MGTDIKAGTSGQAQHAMLGRRKAWVAGASAIAAGCAPRDGMAQTPRDLVQALMPLSLLSAPGRQIFEDIVSLRFSTQILLCQDGRIFAAGPRGSTVSMILPPGSAISWNLEEAANRRANGQVPRILRERAQARGVNVASLPFLFDIYNRQHTLNREAVTKQMVITVSIVLHRQPHILTGQSDTRRTLFALGWQVGWGRSGDGLGFGTSQGIPLALFSDGSGSLDEYVLAVVDRAVDVGLAPLM